MSAPAPVDVAAVLELPMLGAAVEHARHDLPVYPVAPRNKRPLHRGWQRAATCKIGHLVATWRKTPEANVGVLCRDIVVVDADSERGEDALADLGLPATTTVRTRRGSHLYFAGRAPTLKAILKDVEIRGSGSGVIGAGSIHPTGFEYAWSIPPWEVPPVPLPTVLGELIDAHRGTTAVDRGTTAYATPGRRNHDLTRLAGSLRGRYGIEKLEPVLQAVNAAWCRPPLSEEEIAKIARSASKWAHPPLWLRDPLIYTCSDARLTTLARVILRLLCDHAHHDGTCFPGQRRLCELTKASRRRVVAAIRELEEAGRISVRRSPHGNRYTLLAWDSNVIPLSPKGGSSGSHVGTTDGEPRVAA